MAIDKFDKSFKMILKQEGGFVDHPKDPGGATNKGITLATLSSYRGIPASKDSLKMLSDEEAKEIYKTQYWDSIGGSSINDPVISNMIFDQYVNKGSRVKKHVEQLLDLPVDGSIGTDVINKINSMNPSEQRAFKESFIQKELDDYTELVQRKPELKVFYNGWVKRLSNLAKDSGITFKGPNLNQLKTLDNVGHKAYFQSDFVPDFEDYLEINEAGLLDIKSGLFRFNDILLGIPPESIQILTDEHQDSLLLLRTEVPVSIQSGKKRIRIIVNFPIDISANSTGLSELAKMLIQIRKTPIATVENEKIRKELFGNLTTMTNIGVVVDNINGYVDEEYPNLIRCTLQMSWFNHTPYVDDLKYINTLATGEKIYQKFPSKNFKKFYENGTLIGDQVFINDPNSTVEGQNGLIILYKEYQRFDNVVTYKKHASLVSKLESGRKQITPENYLNIKALEEQGWYTAEDQERHEDTPIEGVFYKWNKIEIPFSEVKESGALLLQNMSFSLSTNPSYISMEQHSIPTIQFLGGSVADIRAIIFADSEVESVDQKNNYKTSEIPVGTSKKLGMLQSIFKKISEDRISYPKFSKENHLLIAHPIAKLMKYKPQDNKDKDLYYVDEQNNKQKFNINSFLPVIVSNTSSATITGLPFASKFQIDFKETRLARNKKNIKSLGEVGSEKGKNVYRKLVDKVVNRFGIIFDAASKKFVMSNKPKSLSQEAIYASELLLAFNGSLYADDSIKSIDDLFGSPVFNLSYDQIKDRVKFIANSKNNKVTDNSYINEFKNRYKNNQVRDAIKNKNKLASSQANKEARAKIAGMPSLFFNKTYLNNDYILKFYISFIKDLHTGTFPWVQDYTDTFDEYVTLEANPYKDLYPDMMIPKEENNPAFYFADNSIRVKNYKNRIIKNIPNVSAKTDANMQNRALNPKFAEQVGKDLKPGTTNFRMSFNTFAYPDSKDKGLAAIHDPNNQSFRIHTSQKAIMDMTPHTHSLNQVYPTFQVQLFSDRYNFLQKYSAADIKSTNLFEEEQRDLLDIFDLSSIIDIRIIKDEHEAADVMVIRVLATNKYDLSNLGDPTFNPEQFSVSRLLKDIASGRSMVAKKYDANLERAGLKEGIKIKALLGYLNDTNGLTVEFSGRIAAINGKDVIEIYAVGNGHELIQNTLGFESGAEKYTFNSDTPDLIGKILATANEVKSFGNTQLELGKGITINTPMMLGGRSALDNIYAPTLHPSGHTTSNFVSGVYDKALKTFSYATTAYGVGMLIPVIAGVIGAVSFGTVAVAAGLIGLIAGAGIETYDFIKKKIKPGTFIVFQQTIWDVLQELTLRHPGFVCSVLPFDNRSTIFFGEPDNPFFYRGPQSALEKTIKAFNTSAPRSTLREVADGKSQYQDMKTILDIEDPTMPISNASAKERNKTKQEKTKDAFTKGDIERLSLEGMQRNFRTYHLVTSEHDIISNQIEASSMDVANSVQIYHPGSSGDAEIGGGQQYVKDYKLTDRMKADDDLYSHLINNKVFTFHNAHEDFKGLELPQRYAKAILCKELGKIYKGKIIFLGRPAIKPHDIVILRDTYNQMSGPVAVSRVMQMISPSNGWITIVYPKFIAIPDTSAGAFQMSNILKAARYWLADEGDLFYSNMEKFNPNENTGSSKQGDELIRAWEQTFSKRKEVDKDMMYERGEEFINAATNSNARATTLLVGQTVGGTLAPGIAKGAVTAGKETIAASKALVGTVTGAIKSKDFTGGIVNSGAGLLNVGVKGGSTALRAGGAAFSAAGGFVLSNILDSAIEGFISWNKYREPIYVFPLKKDNVPFMAALNGMKENTLLEHIEFQSTQAADKMGAMVYYTRDFFNSWVGEAPNKFRISNGEKAASITDGDTIVLKNGERIRLNGYDSAETKSSEEHTPNSNEIRMGQEAKRVLESFIGNNELTVERNNTDRYGRTLARIKVGNQDVNDYIINYRGPGGGPLVFVYNGEYKYDKNKPKDQNSLRDWDKAAKEYFGQ